MKVQFVTLTAIVALTTALPSNPELPNDNDATVITRSTNPADFNFTEDLSGPLSKVFSAIDDIPKTVLEEGDAAVSTWLEEHGLRGRELHARLDLGKALNPANWLKPAEKVADSARCVLAITNLLDVKVPIDRLLRIRKSIEMLGGVKKAVEKLLQATTVEDKLRIGGEALVELAEELMEIDRVKENCS